MSQKKEKQDYKYGTPCKDHLGNEYINAKEMCLAYGLPYETYQSRKRSGWDIERILTTPPRNYNWHSPNRNMGTPLTKREQRKYKNYHETPGSRVMAEWMAKKKNKLSE